MSFVWGKFQVINMREHTHICTHVDTHSSSILRLNDLDDVNFSLQKQSKSKP